MPLSCCRCERRLSTLQGRDARLAEFIADNPSFSRIACAFDSPHDSKSGLAAAILTLSAKSTGAPASRSLVTSPVFPAPAASTSASPTSSAADPAAAMTLNALAVGSAQLRGRCSQGSAELSPLRVQSKHAGVGHSFRPTESRERAPRASAGPGSSSFVFVFLIFIYSRCVCVTQRGGATGRGPGRSRGACRAGPANRPRQKGSGTARCETQPPLTPPPGWRRVPSIATNQVAREHTR